MRIGRIVEQGSSERVLGDPQDAIPRNCWQRFRIRRCRCIKKKTTGKKHGDRPLDDYIDAVGKVLALPMEEAWRPAVKANVQVSFRLAKLVDEFPLPDETEPGQCFSA